MPATTSCSSVDFIPTTSVEVRYSSKQATASCNTIAGCHHIPAATRCSGVDFTLTTGVESPPTKHNKTLEVSGPITK